MATVIMKIEDVGDDIHIHTVINPPLTEDKTVFTSAELVGLFLRENAQKILDAAEQWGREPEPAPAPAIEAPKLILPDDIQGTPV